MNLGTIAGQAAAVILVVNTTQHATGWGPRWFGLALALALSVFAWWSRGGGDWKDATKALLGGFVVYAAAFGGNAMLIEDEVTEKAQVVRTYEIEVPVPGGPAITEQRSMVVVKDVPVTPERRSFTSPW